MLLSDIINEEFVSQAQRGYFYHKAKTSKKWKRMADEFEDSTPKGKKLPYHVKNHAKNCACNDCKNMAPNDWSDTPEGKFYEKNPHKYGETANKIDWYMKHGRTPCRGGECDEDGPCKRHSRTPEVMDRYLARRKKQNNITADVGQDTISGGAGMDM